MTEREFNRRERRVGRAKRKNLVPMLVGAASVVPIGVLFYLAFGKRPARQPDGRAPARSTDAAPPSAPAPVTASPQAESPRPARADRRPIAPPIPAAGETPARSSAGEEGAVNVEHPFFHTREDIRRARENVVKYAWARKARDSAVRGAEEWCRRTDAELKAMVPQPTRVVERIVHEPGETPNLVVNPSAEEVAKGRPVGWNYYDGSGRCEWGVSEDGRSGKRSAFFRVAGRSGDSDELNLALVAGDSHGYSGRDAFKAMPETEYAFSFWIRGDCPEISVFVQGWKSPRAASGDRVRIGTTVGKVALSGEWKRHEGTFKTGKDTARFALMFHIRARLGDRYRIGQMFHVDDVDIRPTVTEKTAGEDRLKLSSKVFNYGGMFHSCPQAYCLTGDPKYARPVAVVLVELAKGWPRWPVIGEDGTEKTAGAGPGKKGPPWASLSGRSGHLWSDNKILLFGGIAFDLVYDSGEFEKIGAAEGIDAKEIVRRDFCEDGARLLLDHQGRFGNMSGYTQAAIAVCARNAGRPELVHRIVRIFDVMITNQFFHDGLWSERCAYHGQALNLTRLPEALLGWTDPPGYVDKLDGKRFENLDLYKAHPFIERVYRAEMNFLYPDRSSICVNDSSTGEFWQPGHFELVWRRYGAVNLPLSKETVGGVFYHGLRPEGPFRPAPEMTRSGVLAASGFAFLRSDGGSGGRTGEGAEHATALMLTYGDASSSHDHSDGLNIALWGHGEELMADLGYTHTYLRYSWSATTASHSTVLVDKKLQEHGRGELLAFEPDDGRAPSVQFVSASMPKAYAHAGATTYQRDLALVTPQPGLSYVFDVFRVSGGSTHDLMLHAGVKQGWSLSVDGVGMVPQPGTLDGPDTSYGREKRGSQYTRSGWYRFIDGIERGRADGPFRCRFQHRRAGLLATVLPGAGAEVFTGRAPTIRFADGKSNYRDNEAVDRFKMPVVCVRRTGRDLKSTFVSLLEPHAGEPRLEEVLGLRLKNDAGFAAGVRVVTGNTTEYLLSAIPDERLSWKPRDGFAGTGKVSRTVYSPSEILLRGRFGYVSAVGFEVSQLYLVGGGELVFYHPDGGYGIRMVERYAGEVDSIAGDLTGEEVNRLTTSAALPEGDVLAGRMVIVHHADGTSSAYAVESVATKGGRTEIALRGHRAWLLAKFRVQRVLNTPPAFETKDALGKAFDGWYAGKWATVSGKTFEIKAVRLRAERGIWWYGPTVELAEGSDLTGVRPGTEVVIHAARKGDRFEIPASARLLRREGGGWLLRATGPVDLTLPGSGFEVLREGRWVKTGARGRRTGTIRMRITARDLRGAPRSGVEIRAAQ